MNIHLFREMCYVQQILDVQFLDVLDKDGCWAVDRFPVFLQISGENPLHLISDGQF